MPIAIVSSLAYTLDKDLYWDKIHKDTAEKVVSRGILYLLIFAQYATLRYTSDDRLGLMIRWSYGYRYLLAPEEYKPDIENQEYGPAAHNIIIYPTMESDENTPLFRPDRPSTGESPRSSRLRFRSEYEYSTAGTSPIVTSTPLLRRG